ncbi:MAG: hypothetical protein ACE5I7_04970 [Candidatus Binatia bacterium]
MLRSGWSVRQIQSQFYERTALSRDKAAMPTKGAQTQAVNLATAEEEVGDAYVLEFPGLEDQYSESDLEEALVCHLELVLLDLGGRLLLRRLPEAHAAEERT